MFKRENKKRGKNPLSVLYIKYFYYILSVSSLTMIFLL